MVHGPCEFVCSLCPMTSQRLNITLDEEHASKLSRLAARVHVPEGTLARSLLSTAIDDAEPKADTVVAVLNGIDGAFERAERGRQQAQVGETLTLDELSRVARVEVARTAVEDLDRLCRVLSLPTDARARVRASLAPLAELPRLAQQLAGRWEGPRSVAVDAGRLRAPGAGRPCRGGDHPGHALLLGGEQRVTACVLALPARRERRRVGWAAAYGFCGTSRERTSRPVRSSGLHV